MARGLREIAAALGALREPAALATLVRTRGSSYRQPGARMLVLPRGPQTGGISAGCLETDVKERAAAVIAGAGPALAAYDLGGDLDLLWGTGMGCQGKADVLLERVEPGPPPAWLEQACGLLEARRSGALATVFAVRGEAPAAPGTRFLLGAGAPEWAAGLAEPGAGPETRTLELGGAELDLLLEPLRPPVALWVYGAGEHARPIFRLASELGWDLGLADHRPALATQERFPQAARILIGHPPACLESVPWDLGTAALVVSHVWEADKAAVGRLLHAPLGYLGLQGNRRRSARLLGELEAEQGPPSPAARAVLHAPAGLDLGSESPEQIALAMVAEIQATLAGRAGGSLRDRPGRIH